MDTIASLLRGARDFRDREYGEVRSLMPQLAAGQRPGAMVIACSDSRVDPALIFGARPGDLFVVRAVANLVPPPNSDGLDIAVMSAVEVGLKVLEIPHLIICGHSHCAGVGAALNAALSNPASDAQALRDWTKVAEPTCCAVIAEHGERVITKDLARKAEQRLILDSLDNLRGRPWLSELETRGKLTLHGWWFDIATGELWIANPETGDFASI